MKQPQLGKKISELRLAKGLTQTELADKCNLSLRTIQRIETTEVTPRSYTLKLIFKSLNYDGYSSTNKSPSSSVNGLFNFKKYKYSKVMILLIIASTIVFLFLKLHSNNKIQSESKVTNIIEKHQRDIKRWMNNKEIDSVLSKYDKNACILNSICGKIQIRKMMKDVIENNYELMDYNTLSISVGGSIAIEKYENTYRYKGEIRNQNGITEWNYINGSWLIANDVFRDN